MSEYGNVEAATFVANGNLKDALYHIVKIVDGDKKVDIATAAGDATMMGILINAPEAAGRHASVAYQGMGKVVAGAAINSAGVYLTSNSSGRAVVATVNSGDTPKTVIGRALTTAGADGHVISVLLMQPFRLSHGG